MTWKLFFYITVGLLLTGCANQQTISGGPRDETPPTLTNSIPKDQSTNFVGNTLILEFDEYVSVQNLKKELLITPYTEVTYSHKVKKGTIVEITLDSALEANTTYTFNFRNAIVDITEKNKVQNLKLAFSTGDVIDSLYIIGEVKDVMTGEAVAEASVILYAPEDTLTIDGGRPLYVVTTDESGGYSVDNLKASTFQAMVLLEKDGNLKYNKDEEKIGFLAEDVKVDSSLTGIDFQVTTYDYKELKLISGRRQKQYFDFKFNKPVETFELQFTDPAWGDRIFAKQNGEILRLFNSTLADTDSFEIRLQAEDKIGTQVDTTRFIQFKYPNKPAKEPFVQTAFPVNNQKFQAGDSAQITFDFSKPIATYQIDSAFTIMAASDTTQDSTAWRVRPVFENFATKLVFPAQVIRKPITYQFPKGSFVSVEGDTLEQLVLNYGIYNEPDYGLITGKIETDEEAFIIQLLSEGKVEQEIRNIKNFTFRFVQPGNKSIRILVDENKNGKWDAGDYKQRILPERVYFYPNPLPVKANWEVETELIKF